MTAYDRGSDTQLSASGPAAPTPPVTVDATEFSSSDDRSPPRRDQIAIVAALDAVGLIVTVIAAILLASTDVTRTGRWVVLAALAAAALTGVVSTVTLVGLLARRRAYVTNLEKVALRLKSHRGSKPSSSYLTHAESLRDQAIGFGEEGLAARLDAAIAAAERG